MIMPHFNLGFFFLQGLKKLFIKVLLDFFLYVTKSEANLWNLPHFGDVRKIFLNFFK